MTQEQNETLTRTGPGTAMGELFRKYWIPACLSELLPYPNGDPVRLPLLGERLVAFRDSRGRVGLIDEACPHRGASLAMGRNEDCGLRCIYHGWKMGVDGTVLETPSEATRDTLPADLKQTAYPTREAGGLVWTYMGAPEEEPPFPGFSWLDLPSENIWPNHVGQQCNYLQGLEDDFDAAHVAHLHSSEEELERQQGGPVAYRCLGGPHPEMAVSREAWGLKVLMAWQQHEDPDRRVYWITSFIPRAYRYALNPATEDRHPRPREPLPLGRELRGRRGARRDPGRCVARRTRGRRGQSARSRSSSRSPTSPVSSIDAICSSSRTNRAHRP